MRAVFQPFFKDRIQHAPLLRYDNGVRVFGQSVQRRAYIERGARLAINAVGEEVPVEALVFVEGPVEIDVRDAILLQADEPYAEDLADAQPLIAVQHVNDPTTGKVHHVEVFL